MVNDDVGVGGGAACAGQATAINPALAEAMAIVVLVVFTTPPSTK
jgi:hypothetical protein